MKTKTTSRRFKILSILFINLLLGTAIDAQYCSPTFTNGCTNWSNQSITLDSINWTLGSNACTTSDYTAMRTTLVKGVAKQMIVVDSSWCGVAVWVDFNADGTFDSTECLYHIYTAAAHQTYTFNITVPLSVTPGTYRMRVIAGWGTDCYNTASANGYGGCGTYMYGNFDDFTVRVIPPSGAGITELANSDVINLNASPNPAQNYMAVDISGRRADNPTITLTDVTGKAILTKHVNNDREFFDLTSVARGMYFLTYNDSKQMKVVKVKKQ